MGIWNASFTPAQVVDDIARTGRVDALEGVLQELYEKALTNAPVIADVVNETIPATVEYIDCKGFSDVGDRGGVLIRRVATEPVHAGKTTSNNGTVHWEYVIRGAAVSVKQFGAKGDNVTDDRQAIQNAIDFVFYNNGATGVARMAIVHLDGVHRIDDVLMLGHGVGSFKGGLIFDGISQQRRAENGNIGCAIIASFDDRPVLNVQGARRITIRDMWIEGGTDYTTINLANGDWKKKSAWDAIGGVDTDFADQALIEIDGYSGTQPAVPFPAAPVPAFLGTPGAYGRTVSSQIDIINVGGRRAHTAVKLQGADIDSNGDYLRVIGCNFEYCKRGVSIGNGQSRNVYIQSLKLAIMWVGITNNTHGKKRGRFDGTIHNFSGGYVANIFDFSNSAEFGSPDCANWHFESAYRIGILEASNSNSNSLHLKSLLFNTRTGYGEGGRPATMIAVKDSSGNFDTGASTTQQITISDSQFTGINVECFNSQAHRVRLQRVRLLASNRLTGTIARSLATFNNGTGGGWCPRYNAQYSEPAETFFKVFNTDTGTFFTDAELGSEFGHVQTNRPYGICRWVHKIRHFSERHKEGFTPRYEIPWSRPKSSTFTSVTLTGITLTLVFTSLADYQAHLNGVSVGDHITDDRTGNVFIIESRSGTTVTARMLTGHETTDGGTTYTYDETATFSTTDGNLVFHNNRHFTTSYQCLVQFDTASSTADYGTRSGSTSFMDSSTTGVVVGDYLGNDSLRDGEHLNSERELTAIDSSAGTLTFAGAAPRSNRTDFWAHTWIRPGSPNE